MNAQEALKIYLLNRGHAITYIKNLMRWDPKKTVAENKRLLGFNSHVHANNFKIRFNLNARENYHYKAKTNRESLMILQKNGLNKSEIARLLGVSPQRIAQLLKAK